MSQLAERLCQAFYGKAEHPYRVFEKMIEKVLSPGGVLLDAGCGRTAPVLQKFRNRAGRLIGTDVVDFSIRQTGMELIVADLEAIPLANEAVNVVMSRSVFEHIASPEAVYRELHRILKPGGCVVFLTANVWDYATVIARLVPNRLHPAIVARTEGRAEEDVFPTCYKTNSLQAVTRLSSASGFQIEMFDYLGQYPNYFMFNAPLFLIGTCYDKLVSNFECLKMLRGWILVVLRKPV